jgi:hypothetical protein
MGLARRGDKDPVGAGPLLDGDALDLRDERLHFTHRRQVATEEDVREAKLAGAQ